MNEILHLFGHQLCNVLSEAFELLQGRNCACRDRERLRAENVTEVLILLDEGFKRLHSLTFLFQHNFKTGSYIFLLLKHCVCPLLLKTAKQTTLTYGFSQQISSLGTWDKQILCMG